MTAMPVLPFDVHTRAGCESYLDGLRLGAARHGWDCNACIAAANVATRRSRRMIPSHSRQHRSEV